MKRKLFNFVKIEKGLMMCEVAIKPEIVVFEKMNITVKPRTHLGIIRHLLMKGSMKKNTFKIDSLWVIGCNYPQASLDYKMYDHLVGCDVLEPETMVRKVCHSFGELKVENGLVDDKQSLLGRLAIWNFDEGFTSDWSLVKPSDPPGTYYYRGSKWNPISPPGYLGLKIVGHRGIRFISCMLSKNYDSDFETRVKKRFEFYSAIVDIVYFIPISATWIYKGMSQVWDFIRWKDTSLV